MVGSMFRQRVTIGISSTPAKCGKTTVPHPKKDLGIVVIKSIERQSGVMLRDTK